MLCVVIYENDECPHMWRGPNDASEEAASGPHRDAALSTHTPSPQPRARLEADHLYHLLLL